MFFKPIYVPFLNYFLNIHTYTWNFEAKFANNLDLWLWFGWVKKVPHVSTGLSVIIIFNISSGFTGLGDQKMKSLLLKKKEEVGGANSDDSGLEYQLTVREHDTKSEQSILQYSRVGSFYT